MNLSLKGFSQLIEDMSAALQSSATTLIDVSVGSVVRAIFEANASVALWIAYSAGSTDDKSLDFDRFGSRLLDAGFRAEPPSRGSIDRYRHLFPLCGKSGRNNTGG
jgi:hypothetical protein